MYNIYHSSFYDIDSFMPIQLVGTKNTRVTKKKPWKFLIT